MDKKNVIILIIAVGIILRLLFMPTTFASDTLYRSYYSSFFSSEGVIDIYDYAEKNDLCFINFEGKQICYVYPPSVYFAIGLPQLMLKPVSFGTAEWMDRFENVSKTYREGAGYPPAVPNYNLLYTQNVKLLHWNLFLSKLPFFFLDIAVLLLLLKFAGTEKKFASIFWALNPILIYTSEIVGNIDIIIVLLILLSFFFLKKEKVFLALLCIGTAATLKIFPILFLAPLVIIYSRSIIDIVKNSAYGILPFAAMLAPFIGSLGHFTAIFSVGWAREYPAFIAQPIKALTGIDLGHFIAPYIILTAFFLLLILAKRPQRKVINYSNSILVICLIFFAFSAFNLSYIMWAIPSLFMLGITKKEHRKHIWLILILPVIFNNLYSDQKELALGLLTPVLPSVYESSRALIDYFSPGIVKVTFLILRASFSLLCIFIIAKLYSYINSEKKA